MVGIPMRADVKKKALRRLKIIQGQVKGLLGMIENDMYCVDIITQSNAVKEALGGMEDLVLENHLATHVREQMKNGKDKKAIDEVMKVYKLAQRKK